MRYVSEEGFEAEHFASGVSGVAEVRWHDWPRVNALCGLPGPEVVRGVAWGIAGQASFEGGFLNFKRALEAGGGTQARLLVSERGAVVGFASVAPDGRWRGTHALDCFAHANHSADLGKLIAALPLPKGKVQAHADAGSTAKIAALREAGFEEEARLARQVTWRDQTLDVLVMSRFV